MKIFYLLLSLGLLFFTSCSDDANEDLGISSDLQVIVIDAFTFFPDQITAEPGETIVFLNQSPAIHQIASQSTENAFDDTGDFLTDSFFENDVASIIIPEDANTGDEFYFYSTYYEDDMATPNGVIVVE